MTPQLIIIGASSRAAAASAVRAGLQPWCADLFADTDLKTITPNVVRCPADGYPHAFARLLLETPEVPWMYTGALENHPDLIDQLSHQRKLWGNGPEGLALARSPFHVQRVLATAGLPRLEVRRGEDEVPDPPRWLRKPLAGSAGQGISVADARRQTGRTHYLQRHIAGPSMSAVFCAKDGTADLLGVTEQLVGESWLNAPPFRYCGNIGPIDVPSALREDLTRIGHVVATECRLRGLLGVDFILADGRPWLVEVNPRYTASVEVLELATGANAIHRHAAAFVDGGGSEQSPPWGPFVGKAILYTPRPFTFRAPPQPNDSDHRYADVPVRGEEILAGWPVLTVLCRGQSPEDVRRGLQSHAAKVQVDCEAI